MGKNSKPKKPEQGQQSNKNHPNAHDVVSFSSSDYNDDVLDNLPVNTLNHVMGQRVYASTNQHEYRGTLAAIILDNVHALDSSRIFVPHKRSTICLSRQEIKHTFIPFDPNTGEDSQNQKEQPGPNSGVQEEGSQGQAQPTNKKKKKKKKKKNAEGGGDDGPMNKNRNADGGSDDGALNKNNEGGDGDGTMSRNTKSEIETTRMESDKAWAAMIDKMVQPGSRVKVVTNCDMEFCGELCGKNERGDLVMRDVREYDHGDELAVGGSREAEWEEMVIHGVHISCLGFQN